jgi:hypothetical protein
MDKQAKIATTREQKTPQGAAESPLETRPTNHKVKFRLKIKRWLKWSMTWERNTPLKDQNDSQATSPR